LMMSGAIFWVLDFLGSGFWELFWISQNLLFWRVNFPEPSRISQNPKKASVSAQAQSTTHDYVMLCRSRIQRVCASTEHNTTNRVTSKTRLRWRGVDGPRLARSNFELKIINLFDSSSFVYFKKPWSTGFWEILFFPEPRTQNPKNPEPKR
jgi:hypothetical protein